MEWYRAFDPRCRDVLVVAEIGINHLGEEEYAVRLVDQAIAAGADAVKFQIYQTKEFYHPDAPAYEIFKRYELSLEGFARVRRHCDQKGVLFFATPLDFVSLRWMIEGKIPLIKVASSDITFEPFLRVIGDYVKTRQGHAILSTGFVGMREIRRAVRFFPRDRLALLYCVSRYPTEASDLDLGFIQTLKRACGTTVGFSDHSLETVFSVVAVAMGARVIERHFTDNPTLQEADHSVSVGPEAFARMVSDIRRVEIALGLGEKRVTDFENQIRALSMRSLYTARPVHKGERVSFDDIKCWRPGEGISLRHFDRVVGKKAKKDYGVYEKV